MEASSLPNGWEEQERRRSLCTSKEKMSASVALDQIESLFLLGRFQDAFLLCREQLAKYDARAVTTTLPPHTAAHKPTANPNNVLHNFAQTKRALHPQAKKEETLRQGFSGSTTARKDDWKATLARNDTATRLVLLMIQLLFELKRHVDVEDFIFEFYGALPHIPLQVFLLMLNLQISLGQLEHAKELAVAYLNAAVVTANPELGNHEEASSRKGKEKADKEEDSLPLEQQQANGGKGPPRLTSTPSAATTSACEEKKRQQELVLFALLFADNDHSKSRKEAKEEENKRWPPFTRQQSLAVLELFVMHILLPLQHYQEASDLLAHLGDATAIPAQKLEVLLFPNLFSKTNIKNPKIKRLRRALFSEQRAAEERKEQPPSSRQQKTAAAATTPIATHSDTFQTTNPASPTSNKVLSDDTSGERSAPLSSSHRVEERDASAITSLPTIRRNTNTDVVVSPSDVTFPQSLFQWIMSLASPITSSISTPTSLAPSSHFAKRHAMTLRYTLWLGLCLVASFLGCYSFLLFLRKDRAPRLLRLLFNNLKELLTAGLSFNRSLPSSTAPSYRPRRRSPPLHRS
ncbi:hypothetical protein QOT17_000385 [Balamuthia mandrillaris]